MKINHQAVDAYLRTARVSAPNQVDRPAGAEKPHTSEAGASSEAANVTISSEARALAAGTGKVDSGKVERLRDQIANGEYKVDSQAVARRMLDVVG